MKFLRGLVLAASLLIASCVGGQSKVDPKGYDLGACSPDGYLAAHVLFVDKDLKMDLVSEEPGVVEKKDNPVVYKFQSKDKKGLSHFVFVTAKGDHKLEMVLNFEKNVGTFLIDDKPAAVLFMLKDDDGAKLAENAMLEFKACVELVNGEDSSDLIKIH